MKGISRSIGGVFVEGFLVLLPVLISYLLLGGFFDLLMSLTQPFLDLLPRTPIRDAYGEEVAAALALASPRLALAAVPTRSRLVVVVLRGGLDGRLRGGAADFFLRNEHEGDRQLRLFALPHQMAIGVIGHVGARLHVVDAGSEDAVAFAQKGQNAFRALERMGKPSIAAVNGFALGGGCDVRCNFM